MGDTRQKGHVIPLSFKTMRVFEDAGFKLKEIIMKEQHNCRATGYWKTNSILAPMTAHFLFNLLNLVLVLSGLAT